MALAMQAALTDLQHALSINFVCVKVSQSVAFAMADRVAIKGKGEMAEIGTQKDIYR